MFGTQEHTARTGFHGVLVAFGAIFLVLWLIRRFPKTFLVLLAFGMAGGIALHLSNKAAYLSQPAAHHAPVPRALTATEQATLDKKRAQDARQVEQIFKAARADAANAKRLAELPPQ